ncbi:MAG: flavin reductase family protein [Deltaproteobacteria bacterium]|nr:flavin reductase family protein [Deltaproteobacteria bacterium]
MSETELRELSWDEAITLASPHPYVLGVTADAAGKPNALGLGWWTICSWEPPMMAVSLGKRRYSRQALEYCRELVVCLIGEEHARGAWICGTKSGRKTDKLALAGFTTVPSLVVKVPTIAECVLAFECQLAGELETGDHILYVGKVVAIRGAAGSPKHLYSLHYRKLVAISATGEVSLAVPHEG